MSDDTISRQAAIDEVRNYYDPEDTDVTSIEDRIKRLPPVQSCGYWDAESGYCALHRPSAQPERQINLDGFETPIEILSELRSQFNCFDGQEEKAYHALSVAIHALSARPEIIYCKDCEFTDGKGPIADGRYWCVLHAGFMDFCSDAERRKDG